MIKAKPKLCIRCKQMKQIFSKKMCIGCWRIEELKKKKQVTPLKRSPIQKISNSQKSRNEIYFKKRKTHLEEKPICEANFSGCIRIATDIHHRFYGKDRSKYFLDETTYWSICRSCHRHGHDHLTSEEAIECGFKLKENE